MNATNYSSTNTIFGPDGKPLTRPALSPARLPALDKAMAELETKAEGAVKPNVEKRGPVLPTQRRRSKSVRGRARAKRSKRSPR